MGSHGGATTSGQIGVLEWLGISEARVGALVAASMEIVAVGRTPHGPVLDQGMGAHAADHPLRIAHIKPRTAFRGMLASGPT